MKFTRTALLGVAAAVTAGSVVFAASHANVEGAIKARKAHMGLNAFNLGILGNMAKGDMAYDAAAPQPAADNLAALAAMNTAAYWPAGSSLADVENTRARPRCGTTSRMSWKRSPHLPARQRPWPPPPARWKASRRTWGPSGALAERAIRPIVSPTRD